MSDDSAASQLDILINTRANLAGVVDTNAGLDQVAGGLGQTAAAAELAGGKAEGAAKQVSDLGRDLTSLRGGTRAAREIFEVMEGGAHSVQGLTGLMRLLVITTDGLAPEVAIVASLGLAIASVFAAHAGGAEKAKDETDKVKGSVDDLAAGTEGAKDRITVSFDAILASEKQLEDSDKRQLDLINQRASQAKELIEIYKQLAISAATNEYLDAIKPGTTDEQRARLKRQLAARTKDIEDETTVNTARADRDTAAEDLAARERGLQDLRSSQQSNADALSTAQDTSADAKNLLTKNGLTAGAPDKDTGDRPLLDSDGKDFGKFAQSQIDSGQKDVNDLRENIRKGGYLSQDVPGIQAEIDQRQKQIDGLTSLLESLRIAARSIDVYSETKAKLDTSPDTSPAALDTKIAQAYADIAKASAELDIKTRAADAALETALTNARQRFQEDQRADQKEKAQTDFNDLKDQLQAEIKDKENALERGGVNPQQTANTKKSIGDLRAEITKLELDFKAQFHDVTPGERELADANETGDIDAGNKAARDTTDAAGGFRGKDKEQHDALIRDQTRQVEYIGQLANGDGLTQLVAAVQKSLQLHSTTADLISRGAASTDTLITTAVQKLQAIEQQIAALEAKVKNGNSH